MKQAVLADTGPLYAAVDPDDAHEKRLRRLSYGKGTVSTVPKLSVFARGFNP